MPPPRPKNIPAGYNLDPQGQVRRIFDDAKLINARISPENSRMMGGGLDAFHIMNQNKGVPAFANPRSPGISASEIAQRKSGQGLMYNQNVQGWVPDTLYNRTHMANPYTGYNETLQSPRGATQPSQPTQPVLNEQQQRWADLAAKNQPSGPPAPRGMGHDTGMGNNPYSGTRAQNIENAKSAGEFGKVQSDYNQANLQTGYQMNNNGAINYNPAENFQGRQNIIDSSPKMWETATRSGTTAGGQAASATSPRMAQLQGKSEGAINEARQVTGTASIANPYGTAKATYGGPQQQATVQNEMGRTVPMQDYLANKNAMAQGNLPLPENPYSGAQNNQSPIKTVEQQGVVQDASGRNQNLGDVIDKNTSTYTDDFGVTRDTPAPIAKEARGAVEGAIEGEANGKVESGGEEGGGGEKEGGGEEEAEEGGGEE